jgi:hypothetical protein
VWRLLWQRILPELQRAGLPVSLPELILAAALSFGFVCLGFLLRLPRQMSGCVLISAGCLALMAAVVPAAQEAAPRAWALMIVIGAWVVRRRWLAEGGE